VYLFVCKCMCVCICICIWMDVYLCVYVYMLPWFDLLISLVQSVEPSIISGRYIVIATSLNIREAKHINAQADTFELWYFNASPVIK
jgi:hypothetical protein